MLKSPLLSWLKHTSEYTMESYPYHILNIWVGLPTIIFGGRANSVGGVQHNCTDDVWYLPRVNGEKLPKSLYFTLERVPFVLKRKTYTLHDYMPSIITSTVISHEIDHS
jgi:hypothetical protein